MSIREDARALLSQRRALRACFGAVVVLGLALLATWPRGTMDAAIRTGQATDTFSVVCVCFLLVLLYLGARFGSDDFSEDAGPQLHEYVALTPVSLIRLVAARVVGGAAHTALLLLLGVPLLVASLSVGGAGLYQLCAALAVLEGAGLAARMWGFLALSVAGARRTLRSIIAVGGIASSVIATFLVAPSVGPFHVLVALSQGLDRAPAWSCAAASTGAAVVLAAAGMAALAGWRARRRLAGET